MSFSKSYDLDAIVVTSSAIYNELTPSFDLTGATDLYLYGVVSRSGTAGSNYDVELSSNIGGAIGRSPIWQDNQSNTVQVVHHAILDGVEDTVNDLRLRVSNFPAGQTITLDLAAVVIYR